MSKLREVLDTLSNMPAVATAPQRLTLEELIAKAETYGKVTIFGSSEVHRNYRVHIDFMTLEGTNLGVKSDFGLQLRPALEQALDRAETIRRQFK